MQCLTAGALGSTINLTSKVSGGALVAGSSVSGSDSLAPSVYIEAAVLLVVSFCIHAFIC